MVPGLLLAWDAYHQRIGVNGVNYALHTTGLLAYIFLLLSLLVTPARKLTGWNVLISFRRALGLYGFFYTCAHFLIFFGFDRALSVRSTVHEMLARRYLQIGTIGLLLMIPLAVTSTDGMVMRLGARRWKKLHRLTYVVAIAAAIHYVLLVKSDVRQPLAFAGALALLLGYRIVNYALDRRQAQALRGVGTRATSAARGEARSPAGGPEGVRKSRHWTGELRVARVFHETPDVRTFRMVPADGGELPFAHQPGQYLNLALEIDGKRVRRSYTIASSPTRGYFCEVTVKRSAAGPGSRHLHDTIRAGATLRISAPAGRFTFDGKDGDRVVLIAGGVGITPLMSMIRFLTDRCWPGDIHLVFAVRREADLIFREELDYLARRFPNLHLCFTLSKEPEGTGWTGSRGGITRELLLRAVPGWPKGPVYLCGPEGMMTATRDLLGALGVADEDIRTEAFVSPAASAQGGASPGADPGMAMAVEAVSGDGEAGAPVDEASFDGDGDVAVGAGARIRFSRSRREAEAAAGMTVLETAEAAGVEIPFECRSGICGQCKTRLVSGRVAMESDDALSAADKARGLILACQAHARGDVTVDA